MRSKLVGKLGLLKDKKPTLPKATIYKGKDSNVNDVVIVTDAWGMRFARYPIDPESLEVVIEKDFYKPELLAMERLVKKGDTVIDIGANIGLFTVFLSKLVGPKGHLYAFEPILDTYWRMRENLALNRCDNAAAYQQALSNKNGTATMNVFPEGYGAWNTFGTPKFGEIIAVSKESVPLIKLDSFAKRENLKKVDFLKIDVEGYEYDVLQGARDMLANNRVKYLSFEISEIPLKGAGRKGEDIFNILKSHGYLAYEYDHKINKFKGPIDTSDAYYQNFYASRSDMTRI